MNEFISGIKDKYIIKLIILTLLFSITFLGVLTINFDSLVGLFYYFFLGFILIFFLSKEELSAYIQVFIVNAFFTIIFVYIQYQVYPDSYGATDPLGSSWTDDSYFFTLCADKIPPKMFTRESYFEYNHFFTDIIKFITPFKIYLPLDVLFFQSLTAAFLAIYTKKYTIQLTGDKQIAKLVFKLCMFSPFLLMHGGAILIRDTMVAALFVMTIYYLNNKSYILPIIAITAQFFIRIGTGFILSFVLIFMYHRDLISFFKRYKFMVFLGSIALIWAGAVIVELAITAGLDGVLLRKGVTLAGREASNVFEEGKGNVLFLFIQNQNFIIKSILSGAYIYLYPFFSLKGIFTSQGLDIRSLLLNLVYPIMLIWLNAMVFAAVLTFDKKYKSVLIAFMIGFILIGLFSLQTRHKTILLPLFYPIVAIGYIYAKKNIKLVAYSMSIIWFIFQLFMALK